MDRNPNIQICGESRDIPKDDIESFLFDLKRFSDEYTDENIFDTYENVFFYRILLETTLREIMWLLLGCFQETG